MADDDGATSGGAGPEQAKMLRRRQRELRTAHARGVMQGVLSMLRPGDVVIDCGANRGSVSVPLAATGAIVHAFEPDPYNLARLTKAMRPFPLTVLHPCAAGTASGSVRLMRAENWQDNPRVASVSSTIIAGGRNIAADADQGFDVPVIDFPAFVDELTAKHGEIALLKMDIEGAELEILETMLARGQFAAIRLTIVETHERKFEHLRARFEDLRRAIGAAYPVTRVNLEWM